MMSVPFLALSQDLALRTRWRSRSRCLSHGFINFDPASKFPHGFPGSFLGSRVGGGFPLASPSL
jgi:hypothetical protein